MSRDSSAPVRDEAGGDAEAEDDGRRARMDAGAYLERIGVDPATVGTADLETLERVQRAHVTRVAFENLAIVGDPYGDREGVTLSVPRLYRKIIERGRGGYPE